MLSAYRHYPQNDMSDQQVKSKQCYVPKFNLGTREKSVKLHIEVVNVINIDVSKPSFAFNHGCD